MPLVALTLLTALVGCTSDPLSGDLVFTDASNYTYEGELIAEEVAWAEGQDGTLDWSGFTTDMRGRSVDPASVAKLSLTAFSLDKAGVLSKVESNDLKMSDVRLYYEFDNTGEEGGRTSADLSEFSIIGNEFVPENDLLAHGPEDGDWTWMASVWSVSPYNAVDSDDDGEVDTEREEIITSVFVVPTAGISATGYSFGVDTATFVFDPDLHSAESLRTSAGLDAYTLDWSLVTTDASGRDFDKKYGDQVIIGHVAEEVSYVEDELARIHEVADAVYIADCYWETDVDLMSATSLDGTTFPGFTPGGTWLVGVECTQCTSPAPLILAVVEVED